jgi:hypothetical protein
VEERLSSLENNGHPEDIDAGNHISSKSMGCLDIEDSSCGFDIFSSSRSCPCKNKEENSSVSVVVFPTVNYVCYQSSPNLVTYHNWHQLLFRLEKIYNARIIRCEANNCGHLILEESMNCVTKCVSEQCHKEAKYDEEPLEDGEVDERRAILFAQCVRNEITKKRARGRSQ